MLIKMIQPNVGKFSCSISSVAYLFRGSDTTAVAPLEPSRTVAPKSYAFMMAKEEIVRCVSWDEVQ
jgi:hypothetical protein